MSQPKITMYTRPGCPDVARASYFLRQRGMTWDEIDITEDEAARLQVIAWTGREVTPTLWIGDTMLTEPDGIEIDAALSAVARNALRAPPVYAILGPCECGRRKAQGIEWWNRMVERIALVGPTASGKTAVGIHLAGQLGAEIVSADSMQVYRHMDIGTAKPTPEERRQAAFHGIDVAEPDQDWTLTDFQHLGEEVCRALAARGKVPLIVGGTGLYVRSLMTVLDVPTAPPDQAFRARWREFAGTNGNAALLAHLAGIDPGTAARLHVNDIGRQIRALEVHAASGRTLTELHAENRARQPQEQPLLFGLNFADRALLYRRIDDRVDQMVEEGLLDEVRGLLARGYSAALKPMRSLGYRHMAAALTGDMSFGLALAAMKQDTRRFARRQLIWFRGDPRVQWISADGKPAGQIADEIYAQLQVLRQHKGDIASQ